MCNKCAKKLFTNFAILQSCILISKIFMMFTSLVYKHFFFFNNFFPIFIIFFFNFNNKQFLEINKRDPYIITSSFRTPYTSALYTILIEIRPENRPCIYLQDPFTKDSIINAQTILYFICFWSGNFQNPYVDLLLSFCFILLVIFYVNLLLQLDLCLSLFS